jgi:hypothetical protein
MTDAACACLNVKCTKIPNPDGSFHERWSCSLCGAEFLRRKMIEGGPRLSDAELLESVDAAVWAREFCKIWREKVYPDQPCPDEGWMIAWFANAMMGMYDHVEREHEKQDPAAPTLTEWISSRSEDGTEIALDGSERWADHIPLSVIGSRPMRVVARFWAPDWESAKKIHNAINGWDKQSAPAPTSATMTDEKQPELTEREREAWEMYCKDNRRVCGPPAAWSELFREAREHYLGMRDRLAELWSAERHELEARVDDFERLHQADQERIAYLEHELAILPAARPRIVCLCGSTRFYQQFKEANYRETMAGKIVLSVGFYPHAQAQEHGQHLGVTDEQKLALDELHKRKIDLADEVLVLDVGGYIGESTKSEIEHAKRAGKPIRYLSAQSDPVGAAEAFAAMNGDMPETAPSGELRAEQAIGVALSVVMATTEMGECQELAPGFLRHLAAMGWALTPVQEQTAAQALAKVTLAIGSQRLAIQDNFIKAFVEETGGKIADCVLKEEIKDGKISWWLEHRPVPEAEPATPLDEHTHGVYGKFHVARTDGSSRPGGKHEHCEYFVLDWKHDKFAVPAATAYAIACESEFPELARDLRRKVGQYAPAEPLAVPKSDLLKADWRRPEIVREIVEAFRAWNLGVELVSAWSLQRWLAYQTEQTRDEWIASQARKPVEAPSAAPNFGLPEKNEETLPDVADFHARLGWLIDVLERDFNYRGYPGQPARPEVFAVELLKRLLPKSEPAAVYVGFDPGNKDGDTAAFVEATRNTDGSISITDMAFGKQAEEKAAQHAKRGTASPAAPAVETPELDEVSRFSLVDGIYAEPRAGLERKLVGRWVLFEDVKAAYQRELARATETLTRERDEARAKLVEAEAKLAPRTNVAVGDKGTT